MHVTGECEMCGEPGNRVQIKPKGGQLPRGVVAHGGSTIVLCPKHLYTMHGFFPQLTDDGATDRRSRRAEFRKRLQRTVA